MYIILLIINSDGSDYDALDIRRAGGPSKSTRPADQLLLVPSMEYIAKLITGQLAI